MTRTCSRTGMMLVCVLSVLGGTVIAFEESPSASAQSQHFNSFIDGLNEEAPEHKRAYTYVSEYKRLPLFNFGLGKRFVDAGYKRASPYSFGIGKRTNPYNFGLGKRDDSLQFNPYTSVDYPDDLENLRRKVEELVEEKRSAGLYNFGLGKRNSLEFREENAAASDAKGSNVQRADRYQFGIGKRIPLDENSMA